MQLFKSVCTAALLLICALSVHAQSATADYFAGKWNVLVKGTPNGDAKLSFLLEKKGGTITGVVQDSTGQEISKIEKAELADNEITLYFNTQGYDVNLNLKKKDDDHAKGNLMNMFEAEGDRVKTVTK